MTNAGRNIASAIPATSSASRQRPSSAAASPASARRSSSSVTAISTASRATGRIAASKSSRGHWRIAMRWYGGSGLAPRFVASAPNASSSSTIRVAARISSLSAPRQFNRGSTAASRRSAASLPYRTSWPGAPAMTMSARGPFAPEVRASRTSCTSDPASRTRSDLGPMKLVPPTGPMPRTNSSAHAPANTMPQEASANELVAAPASSAPPMAAPPDHPKAAALGVERKSAPDGHGGDDLVPAERALADVTPVVHVNARLSRHLIHPIQRRHLVRLGERRIVEHRVAEIVDRPAHRQHRLPDVNDLRRALAHHVHA